MSQKSLIIFAGLAAAVTLGAVQLASGHDLADRYLTDRFQAVADPAGAGGFKGATSVNRTAKADREAAPKAAGEARTV